MRLLVSWLRDFVDVKATAEEIGEGLGLRGFELAGIEPVGDGDAVIDFEVTANRPDCLSVVGLELGHPTHAFDLDKLAGPEIRVRRAKAGERITTLDGIARTLDADMLAI